MLVIEIIMNVFAFLILTSSKNKKENVDAYHVSDLVSHSLNLCIQLCTGFTQLLYFIPDNYSRNKCIRTIKNGLFQDVPFQKGRSKSGLERAALPSQATHLLEQMQLVRCCRP